MNTSDVIIIGAGPVGLFAVHQCGMLGLSTQVVDALPEIGGQCTALYPEKPIYDIPAWPRIDAGELIHQLEAQAAPFKPVYHLGHPVVTCEKIEDHFHLMTAGNTALRARAIIIASGAGAFGPNRPPLAHIEAYEGHSILYMVRRREEFRDKHIVIAGGGDSAVDWALSLSEVAASLTVIHRRPKFRAAEDSVRQLHEIAEAGAITLMTPYQLKALKGDAPQLSHVIAAHTDGTETAIAADVLLPFFGLSTDLGPIAEWGLETGHHTILAEPGTCATNIPGIYAIGDGAHYPHKLKLILTGFADAAHAAHAIRSYLYPDREFHFEYSTTKGLPGQENKG